MVKQNSMINIGFCQGLVKGRVYLPKSTIAKLNVQVRCDRKNPKTRKREIHVLNFTVYGNEAEKLAEIADDGDVVFITYHLESKVRVNRQNGISTITEENVADCISVFKQDFSGRTPYLNHGFFQGRYLGVIAQPNSSGIYILTIYAENHETGEKVHMPFVIYGPLGKTIEEKYKKGQCILVEYKIEKSKRIRRDNSVEHFTNRVVERIG